MFYSGVKQSRYNKCTDSLAKQDWLSSQNIMVHTVSDIHNKSVVEICYIIETSVYLENVHVYMVISKGWKGSKW